MQLNLSDPVNWIAPVISIDISDGETKTHEEGKEYLQFKEYDKASAYLTEGLQYNRDIDNKSGTLRTLNSIGHLNLAQVHAALAYYHANRAEIDAELAEEEAEYDRLASAQKTAQKTGDGHAQ